MNFDILVKNLNHLIITAIEHGGDCGGAYLSCPSRLKKEMQNLLYTIPNLADTYKVKETYIEEFLAEIPQFIKI